MASGSITSSIANSSSLPKSSRFSTTLKVFKFASKEAKASPLPPPPPPKDYPYAGNRSFVSLSPDSLSVPDTPRSLHPPHPYFLSTDANQSSVSVSTAASAASYAMADGSSHKGPKKTKSGFFKFPKRSPRGNSTKSPSSDDLPPIPGPDDNIGIPFNFQHNIHVDEGLTGLPPSWNSSLSQAGFTEEEIAEIHARRAAGRPHYLYSDRPSSPAYTATDSSIFIHPGPRSASLSRQVSGASRDGSVEPQQLLHSPSLSRLGSVHSSTSSTRSLSQRPSIDEASRQLQPSITSRTPSGSTNTQATDGTNTARTTSPSYSSPRPAPITPPRRAYHVTNEEMHSPPPSYSNSTPNGKPSAYLPDQKDSSLFQSSATPSMHAVSKTTSHTASPELPDTSRQHSLNPNGLHDLDRSSSTSSGTTTPDEPEGSDGLRKRLTALPPRLSLHKSMDSTDLSSWGASLLSGISASSTTQGPSIFSFGREQTGPSAGDGRSLSSTGSSPGLSPNTPSLPMNYQTQNGRTPLPSRPIPLPKDNAMAKASHSDDGERFASPSVNPPKICDDPLAEIWDAIERLSPVSPEGSSVLPTIRAERDIVQGAHNAGRTVDSLSSNPKGNRSQPASDGEDDSDEKLLTAGQQGRQHRDSSRSSVSTVTGEPATIVRSASIARRAGAYVIDNLCVKGGRREADQGRESNASPGAAVAPVPSIVVEGKHLKAPFSLNSCGKQGFASTLRSSGTLSQEHQRPMSEADMDSPLTYYLDPPPSLSVSKFSFAPSLSQPPTTSVVDSIKDVQEDFVHLPRRGNSSADPPPRPKIVISDATSPGFPVTLTATTTVATPFTPFQRYPGWLSSVVKPLEQFIDEAIDPREYYLDLHEIAEGESGSVFASRLANKNRHKLKLPSSVKARDADDLANDRPTLVAIKSVAILPSGSPKLVDLERELSLMKGLSHDHVLSMDGVYVDLVEDTLWIRMELMERSLADIVGLVPDGLMLQDRMIARFASDILLALEFLQEHSIAHRDVRSDNLLLNSQGVLKLTDFSNAMRVSRDSPMCLDTAGVLYWQAPEIRNPPYNALQVDVWSLGATVWEMAEAEPPFAATQQISERWPPLSNPQLYSPSFHEFLRVCSQPPSSRPAAADLKKTSFINNACGRPVIIQLVSQCMAIEQTIQQERAASQGSALE